MSLLICAGLDPSGGAGLIADVRVATACGVRPVGVVTALTVQNTTGVTAYTAVDESTLRDQLDFLLLDVEVRAVKVGMLGSPGVATQLGKALELTAAPLVWDPVFGPSRGTVSFAQGSLDLPLAALLPHLTLVTPNRFELQLFAGRELRDEAAQVEAAQQLAARWDAAVLVKGGHRADDTAPDDRTEIVDWVVTATSREALRGPRVPGGEHVHGTGCALSTAIAAHLARGLPLVEACRAAKAFVAARIAAPVHPGRGAGAVV